MTEFIYFLGRFHVLVLHLPIGILMLAVLMEVLYRRPRYAALGPAVSLAWLAGGVTALITVALGYMHASEPGFSGPAVNHHRWAGTILALTAMAIWAVRLEAPRMFARFWPVPLVAILALMTITGHLGGNLTHGETYLTEFAPGPLRSAATASGDDPEDAPRPPVTDVAQADIYLDIVAPALKLRCESCHNSGKKRGGLTIRPYASLMEGGENGAVIVPGNPDASDLYHRISVDPDHVDHMPKNGKTPLSPQQVEAIRFWIEKGAPQQGQVSTLEPSDDLLDALRGAIVR